MNTREREKLQFCLYSEKWEELDIFLNIFPLTTLINTQTFSKEIKSHENRATA